MISRKLEPGDFIRWDDRVYVFLDYGGGHGNLIHAFPFEENGPDIQMPVEEFSELNRATIGALSTAMWFDWETWPENIRARAPEEPQDCVAR